MKPEQYPQPKHEEPADQGSENQLENETKFQLGDLAQQFDKLIQLEFGEEVLDMEIDLTNTEVDEDGNITSIDAVLPKAIAKQQGLDGIFYTFTIKGKSSQDTCIDLAYESEGVVEHAEERARYNYETNEWDLLISDPGINSRNDFSRPTMEEREVSATEESVDQGTESGGHLEEIITIDPEQLEENEFISITQRMAEMSSYYVNSVFTRQERINEFVKSGIKPINFAMHSFQVYYPKGVEKKVDETLRKLQFVAYRIALDLRELKELRSKSISQDYGLPAQIEKNAFEFIKDAQEFVLAIGGDERLTHPNRSVIDDKIIWQAYNDLIVFVRHTFDYDLKEENR